MTMQVMHIQGMLFVYQKHIKYEHTRFWYSASTNTQPTVSRFVFWKVSKCSENRIF